MSYPLGLIFFGIPIGLLAIGVECVIRKVVRNSGDAQSFQKKRQIKFVARGVTLAIITVVYFFIERVRQ